MRFYLGTHHPHWLSSADVPLFVSRRALVRYKTPPRAVGPWALDSGGFTELSMNGRWSIEPQQYVEEVHAWRSAVGGLAFAAPMDWMCEPGIRAKTGLSLVEHQRRTVENLLRLRKLAPELPWIPVLQGWEYADYLRHLAMYRSEGIDLAAEPLVGVGSVCRRQKTTMAEDLIRELHGRGLRVHAFGFKLLGLRRCARYLASADSMAWSYDARRADPLPGCTHKSCANCMKYALWWRKKALLAASGSQAARQGVLFN